MGTTWLTEKSPTAVAVALGVGLTLLVTLLPSVQLAYENPQLHLALETAEGIIAAHLAPHRARYPWRVRRRPEPDLHRHAHHRGRLTVVVGNVVAVFGFVALVAALEVQVCGVEEPYLASVHGERYRAYASRAGRFVPALGRFRAS